ncbi:hypothetical protein [Niastella sp. OAS944]|uniref:hypothetical protein n=1 Tax=Niastella sp. OAS944 TaxID=2664089 RepID=UPI003481F7A8|nr:hypothetical protein [Chitinophagaceae bacterium OAS944]
MKRNLLGFAAVVLAIAVSSFTAKLNTTYYMVYNSGSQNVMSNYDAPTAEEQDAVIGSDRLAWISIESADSQIDNAEFLAAFSALDANSTSSLDDESEKNITFTYSGNSTLHTQLEKKAAQ